MRPVSEKTAARNAEAQPMRDELKAEVGHCEICGHDPRRIRPGRIAWALHVHEIARGVHRQKAQDKRFALLVVCWLCHNDKLPSRREWPEARQLAALKRSRPQDYDLAEYNELVGRGPKRITEEDVEGWLSSKRARGRETIPENVAMVRMLAEVDRDIRHIQDSDLRNQCPPGLVLMPCQGCGELVVGVMTVCSFVRSAPKRREGSDGLN